MTSQYEVSLEKIITSFRDLGIKKGDILLLHSDTDLLSELLPDGDKVDQFALLETSLRELLGEEGTLVVPTFTYSFCEGRRFDPVKRNSAVGLFTNYIRRREDAFRSHHPVFSFSAIGKHASEITNEVSVYGFGIGSVFDRLTEMGGKISCFNIEFQKCCTYVHYIEELHGVDYRYHKTFSGEIAINGTKKPAEAINYVRNLERNVISDFDSFAKELADLGHLKKTALGSGFIQAYSCQQTFEAGIHALTKDNHIFLAHSPE